jgi:hypothetical protein
MQADATCWSPAVRVASPAAADAGELLADLAAEAGEEAEPERQGRPSTMGRDGSTLP